MWETFPLEDKGINDLKIYTYVHKSVLILISCFVCAFMCHCRGVTGWVFLYTQSIMSQYLRGLEMYRSSRIYTCPTCCCCADFAHCTDNILHIIVMGTDYGVPIIMSLHICCLRQSIWTCTQIYNMLITFKSIFKFAW